MGRRLLLLRSGVFCTLLQASLQLFCWSSHVPLSSSERTRWGIIRFLWGILKAAGFPGTGLYRS